MAQRVEIRQVTSAAGTAQSAAVETNLSFDPGIVRAIEILIPAGHAGETGIAIAQAHQIIIPYDGTDWIIGDDNLLTWPVDDYLQTGSWSAFTYNTDAFNDHTWYVRFHVDELGAAVSTAAPQPLSEAAIMTGGTA